jgi:Zn ribbon nucleic-acid-binding protein
MSKRKYNKCPICKGTLKILRESKDGTNYFCVNCGWTATIHGKTHFKPERKNDKIEFFE